MTRRIARTALAALALLATAGPGVASAAIVNYRAQGTDILPGTTFDAGGITVTGSGPLEIRSDFGLGIIGGAGIGNGGQQIDNGETARFSFDGGPATGVSLLSTGIGSPTGNFVGTFQGFGASGQSLGTYNYFITPLQNPVNISAIFGNVVLSAFSFTGGEPGAGISVASITYTSAVPEPTSLAMVGLGLAGAGVVARMRRRD